VPPDPTPDLFQLHAIIRGAVQGVNFRVFTRRIANQLQLTGWVRNKLDGSVEALAEGSSHALAIFEQHLAKGPPNARVDQIDTTKIPAQRQFTTFTIGPTK